MTKALIIHPADHTTDFLKTTYESLPNKTIITGGVSKDDVIKMIQSHDRVMMMGHGSPLSLLSMGQFNSTNGYIIDHTIVPCLKEKTQSIFIWCDANIFVEYNGLSGIYTGMFISEVREAIYCGLPNSNQEMVDESNTAFCGALLKVIGEECDVIY